MLFLLWVMLKKNKKTVTPKAIPNPSISQIYTKNTIKFISKKLIQQKTKSKHPHPTNIFQKKKRKSKTIPSQKPPQWSQLASSSKSNSSAKSTASKTSPEPARRRPVGPAASAMTSWQPEGKVVVGGVVGVGWKREPNKKYGGVSGLKYKKHGGNWVDEFEVQ